MPPYHSGDQTHVMQLVLIFLTLAIHDVEQLLHKSLRTVEQVNWHIVHLSCQDLLLPQPPKSLLLLLLELMLLMLGLLHNALQSPNILGVNSVIIVTVRQLFQLHGGFHEEEASHQSNLGGWSKTSLSNDVDSPGISPYVSLVQLNHQFDGLLSSLVSMLGHIARDKSPQLLVDLVVLMVLVHSSNVIQHIFVYHRTELLVLQAHLPQQELNRAHWDEDALGPQDHDASDALFPEVGVKGGAKFLHESHDDLGQPAQYLGEMLDTPGKEDEEFPKALVFPHSVTLNLIELNLEEVMIELDIDFVEDRIIINFHGDVLQFFEEGVIDGLLVLFLLHHC